MRIELWAKKLDKGHTKIGEVDVSDSFGYEYKLPVKMPVSVQAIENLGITSTSPMSNYRTFIYSPAVDNRAFNLPRRYLEQ